MQKRWAGFLETGIAVEIFKAGDGGQMVNQAVLARDNPLADVMYGVDNTFLSRALASDIFLAYASPELANIDDALKGRSAKSRFAGRFWRCLSELR